MVLNNKFAIDNPIELAKIEEKISKKKALELFETGMLDTFPIGKFEGLAKIHSFMFGEIYDFAGKLCKENNF